MPTLTQNSIISHISAQRKKENKKVGDFNAIYIVYDLIETYVPYDHDFDADTSLISHRMKEKYIRFGDEGITRKAERNTDKWYEDITIDGMNYNPVVRVVYHDRLVTVCFTRKAAREFIKRESHKLFHPHIQSVHALWRNTELKLLLQLFDGNNNE